MLNNFSQTLRRNKYSDRPPPSITLKRLYVSLRTDVFQVGPETQAKFRENIPRPTGYIVNPFTGKLKLPRNGVIPF